MFQESAQDSSTATHDEGGLVAAIDALAAEARNRWAAAGASDEQLLALDRVQYEVADLEGSAVGVAEDGTITIDQNAAGLGWFIDQTPGDDAEFSWESDAFSAVDPNAQDTVDLLTVLMHEQGHLLGLLDDNADLSDIMHGWIGEGERRAIDLNRAAGSEALSLEGQHFMSAMGIDSLSITAAINEGDTATVSGTVNDATPGGTYTLTINWDSTNNTEGTAQVISLGTSNINSGGVSWDATSKVFQITHTYADDNPTATASDNYNVSVDLERVPNPANAIPIGQQLDKITSSTAAEEDEFGGSVAISGNFAAVGVPYDENPGANWSGSVIIYERQSDHTWNEITRITAKDLVAGSEVDDFDFGDAFGASVALDGNLLVVGATHADLANNARQEGAAYVFERDSGTGTWNFRDKLLQQTGDTNISGFFGSAVAIDGDTIVVGALGKDVAGNVQAGAAYVFERSATDQWDQASKFTATDPGNAFRFGESVAIDGDRVVVGAPQNGNGAAYIFEKGAGWLANQTETTKLVSSDGGGADRFGISVDIEGDTIVVGARTHSITLNEGAAYIYESDGVGGWNETKLTHTPGIDPNAIGDQFGSAVSISNGIIAVSAPQTNYSIGAGYLFEDDPVNGWQQYAEVTATDGAGSDQLGAVESIAIEGDVVFIGARFDDDDGGSSGSAYFFATEEIPEAVPTPFSATLQTTVSDIAPVIAIDAGDSNSGSFTEDGTTNRMLSGTVSVTDAGTQDTITASTGTTVGTSGPLGTLTVANLLSMFSASGPDANGDITWTFNSGAESFDYLDAGETLVLTYSVVATDDDTLNDSENVTITINGAANNQAPVIDDISPPFYIDEGTEPVIYGRFTPQETNQSHTLVVDWGDSNGAPQSSFLIPAFNSLTLGDIFTSADGAELEITYLLSSPDRINFSITGREYADDPLNDFSLDRYPFSITVTDSQGLQDSADGPIEVQNVDPVINGLALTPTQNENGLVTLSGTIDDPGELDTFTLTINWDKANGTEGTPQVIMLGNSDINGTGGVTWNATTREFSITHQYLDDNPTATASDSYQVEVALIDDDHGSQASGLTLGWLVDDEQFDQGKEVEVNNGEVYTLVKRADQNPAYFYITNQTVDGQYQWTSPRLHLDPIQSSSDRDRYDIAVAADGTSYAVGYNGSSMRLIEIKPDGTQGWLTGIGFSNTPLISDETRVAVANDGSIYTVANYSGSAIGTGVPFAFTTSGILTKWNPDGTPEWSQTVGRFADITVSSNGNVILAGPISSTNGLGRIATLDPDGNLLSFFDAPHQVVAVAEASDGKIVLGGYSGSIVHFSRYLSDGTLEHHYSSPPTSNPTVSRVTGVTISANGDAYFSGEGGTELHVGPHNFSNIAFAVEFRADGTIGWGESIGSFREDAQGIAADNGDIFVAGGSFPAYLTKGATARFTQPENIPPSFTATLNTTIHNVAPDLTIDTGDSNSATFTENGSPNRTATGTISLSDVGTLDTHTPGVGPTVGTSGPLGTITQAQLLAMFSVSGPDASDDLTWNFNSGAETFAYLDAGETLTLTYTLNVSDDDTGTDAETVTIIINGAVGQVGPTIDSLTVLPVIDENDEVWVSGTVNDPNAGDFFTLTINWDQTNNTEGAVETFLLDSIAKTRAVDGYDWDPATKVFRVYHQYLDDNPTSTTQDTYDIGIQIVDDAFDWVQVGSDVVGIDMSDSGFSVALTDDGNRLAVGEPNYFGGGRVMIYDWDGSNWVQTGFVRDEGRHGWSVSFNSSGEFLVVGAPLAEVGGTWSGRASIYRWDSGSATWIPHGHIDAEATFDWSGSGVSLNDAGDRLAIGAHLNDGGGFSAGHVRIYEYTVDAFGIGSWNQMGSDIDGITNDASGAAVKLNASGDRVVIGQVWGTVGANGNTRVYEWDGSDWVQMGSNIVGISSVNSINGSSVDINAAGDRIVVNAVVSNGGPGYARVFEWDGSSWNQLGSTQFGTNRVDAVAMNDSGTVFSMTDSGVSNRDVKTFKWDGSDWIPFGPTNPSSPYYIGGEPALAFDAEANRMALGTEGSETTRVFERTPVNAAYQTTLQTQVNNVAPDLTIDAGDSNAATFTEDGTPNRTATGTISLSDVGTLDTHILSPGGTVTTTGPLGTLTQAQLLAMFSIGGPDQSGNVTWNFDSGAETFAYLDVGETLVLTYTVLATDDDTATDQESVTITINGLQNPVGPSIDFLTVTPIIDEGGEVVLSGTVNDLNPDDTFTLTINWDKLYGREGAPEVFELDNTIRTRAVDGYDWNPATREFSVYHTYEDDDPSATTLDTYDIGVGIVDQEYFEWRRIGSNILGNENNDRFGIDLALNTDGTRLVVGAPFSDANSSLSGEVRTFEWDSTDWQELGTGLQGSDNSDFFGTAVSVDASGNRIAVGAPQRSGPGDQGYVQILEWNGTDWVQLGMDIEGEMLHDENGYSVSLSADGNRVAIGAPENDGAAADAGNVRIYEWDGTNWQQLGNDIDGTVANDLIGHTVRLNATGDRVVFRNPVDPVGGSSVRDSEIRIFEWDGVAWTQLGGVIPSSQTTSGGVDINASGDRILEVVDAAGGLNYVKVHEWDGSNWVQVGSTISGIRGNFSAAFDDLGESFVVRDAEIGNPSTGIKVYQWNGSDWQQSGVEVYNISSGITHTTVSLSGDGKRLALGVLSAGRSSAWIYEQSGSTFLHETTLQTQVRNIAPSIVDIETTPAAEGESVLVSGRITDPGEGDFFTLTVDWDTVNGSEGPPQTISLGFFPINSGGVLWDPATREFIIEHVYLDDNPTATPVDEYRIGLSLRDDDQQVGAMDTFTTEALVQVSNSDPGLTATKAYSSVLLGSPSTIIGRHFDNGTEDSHQLVIDWNDPSQPLSSTFSLPPAGALAAGDQFISSTGHVLEITSIFPGAPDTIFWQVSHTYTQADIHLATVTVIDDDTGTRERTVPFEVVGSPISLELFPTTINEGDPYHILGKVSNFPLLSSARLQGDLGGQTIGNPIRPLFRVVDQFGTLEPVVNVGDTIGRITITSIDSANREFTFRLDGDVIAQDDGPLGNGTPQDRETVIMEIESLGLNVGSDRAATDVTVRNVAPELLVHGAFYHHFDDITYGRAQFTDPGLRDRITLTIDWGDGNVSRFELPSIRNLNSGEVFTAPDGSEIAILTIRGDMVLLSYQHDYEAPGRYDIDFLVEDDDTGQDRGGTSVSIPDSAFFSFSGGSGVIEGFRFVDPGGFRFDEPRGGGFFDDFAPELDEEPLLRVSPVYTGSVSPGSVVTVRILGEGGEQLRGGEITVVADVSGNWSAVFTDLILDQGAHYIVIEESEASWSSFGERRGSQVFFSPAINQGHTTLDRGLVERSLDLVDEGIADRLLAGSGGGGDVVSRERNTDWRALGFGTTTGWDPTNFSFTDDRDMREIWAEMQERMGEAPTSEREFGSTTAEDPNEFSFHDNPEEEFPRETGTGEVTLPTRDRDTAPAIRSSLFPATRSR